MIKKQEVNELTVCGYVLYVRCLTSKQSPHIVTQYLLLERERELLGSVTELLHLMYL